VILIKNEFEDSRKNLEKYFIRMVKKGII